MSAARTVAFTVLFVLSACRDALTPMHAGPRDGASGVIRGQYIVVFRDSVADPAGLARAIVNAQHGTLLHSYASALRGFAARLPDAAVTALQQDTRIASVEPDREDSVPPTRPTVSMSVTQQMDWNGDPWGLDRIDQRALPLSGTYTYTSRGAGVHVYIIDSGIWTAHPDFEGRADIVYDYAGGDGQDCNGHGTLVAGIVGAATYGVAKGVFLHGVRILACPGSFSTTSDAIAGIDWVTAHHQNPAVANLVMFQRDTSTALATAIKGLWDAGVFVATTAGNDNVDACQLASGHTPFAVAASTRSDAKADFSNWGQCVKIYAPGELIKSTWLHGWTSTETGTSFAAPHVTGVAALYKATFGDAPSDVVANWILNNATGGVITGNPAGTPNLLLYSPTAPEPALVANFTSTCSGLTCSFDASSSTAQASATYGWDWGDTTAAGSGETTTHTYAGAGTYNVTLTVTDAGGSNSNMQALTVSPTPPPPPVARFTSSCSELTCSFDARSSTAQDSATYDWDWGDATAAGSGETTTHTYAGAGTYTVTLTVIDAGGWGSTTQAVTVVVGSGSPSSRVTRRPTP